LQLVFFLYEDYVLGFLSFLPQYCAVSLFLLYVEPFLPFFLPCTRALAPPPVRVREPVPWILSVCQHFAIDVPLIFFPVEYASCFFFSPMRTTSPSRCERLLPIEYWSSHTVGETHAIFPSWTSFTPLPNSSSK